MTFIFSPRHLLSTCLMPVAAIILLAACTGANRTVGKPEASSPARRWSGNLGAVDWTGVRSRRTIFFAVRLANARLGAAQLPMLSGNEVEDRASDWRRADLRGWHLIHSTFESSRFDGADLRGAYLADSVIKDVSFVKANLAFSVFKHVAFVRADFSGADLGHVLFNDCRLTNSKFDRHTRLPFSRDEAIRRGMVAVDGPS